MLFTKVPYAANFDFIEKYCADKGQASIGKTKLQVEVSHFEGDIHCIRVTHPELWTEDLNLIALHKPTSGDAGSLELSENLEICIADGMLKSQPGMGFGISGKSALFAFEFSKDFRFYGLGEKTFNRMEVSNLRTRFWNTDVLGDFDGCQWAEGTADPYYVTVPYLIVRRGNTYVGLLYHNPFPTWMDTGTDPSFFGTMDENRKIIIGSEDGVPCLWIIVGPTLAELTSKLQKLVGTTPRPPLWALGYHQCRWEYEGEAHLRELDSQMDKHAIPCDGLWLDIDYMDGYRVFTHSEKAFPHGPKPVLADLLKHGRRCCPIIDPGVKFDPNFPMYKDGLQKGVFCPNPQGKPFVGFVWPGETVYPDFTRLEARTWWAGYAEKFRLEGYAGAWLDMNDPSTGAVDPRSMLFQNGNQPHEAYRNQYALGMQMATYEGFQKAHPNERVFLVSRSGYTGTSRYSAIWTGDNCANRWYLKCSIPTTVNLGLSGIPFNGPDVGGFFFDTNESLMVDWTKACFLFPFFRNHSTGSFRKQEPWTFGKKALETLRYYIRLRYKLLPYLYQVFIEQTERGHPVIRPLNYHAEVDRVPDDMFFVGRDILQAPVLEEAALDRKARLPGKGRWFDARTGEWLSGSCLLENDYAETPLFFRDGAAIPAQTGERMSAKNDLQNVEIHLFLNRYSADLTYTFDDGLTLGYQKGAESKVRIQASMKAGVLSVETEAISTGVGDAQLEFFFYGSPKRVVLNGVRVPVKKAKQRWTGRRALDCIRFSAG